MGRVIVGVDGSAGSRRALEFALDEARMRHATLQVVYVQEPAIPPQHVAGAVYATSSGMETMAEWETEQRETLGRRAREHGERVLGDLVDELTTDDVKVEETLLFDRRPARRLVELVNGLDDVELLVVGSRGRGELTGLLLGSVSQACVTHARVPVVVIPTARL